MEKLFCLILFSLCTTMQAQQSTVASGGNAAGTGGTVSYSVGQISYKSPEGVLISDGVQQPYEIITLGKDGLPDLQLVAFPNPVTDLLRLKNSNPGAGTLSWSLSDISGKTLSEGVYTEAAETSVPMKNYPAGVYLLQVSDQNNKLKTFKIIKK